MMPRPTDRYRPRRVARKLAGTLFAAICRLTTLSGLVVLAVVLGTVVVTALGHRAELGRPAPSGWSPASLIGEALGFLGSLTGRVRPSVEGMDHDYGYRVGIAGSLWLMAMVAGIGIPAGVGAAIFLEEILPPGLVRRAAQANIANLAGVPSVVYGLLGLAAFRDAFGHPGLALGATLWAGGLTLCLLILPLVVTATQEALRAVPGSTRLAALALGATRWMVIRDHILPASLPGIMTGTILSLSRAIGETAPLIVVGAAMSLLVVPRSPSDPYTAIPVEIYVDSMETQEPYHAVAAGGILILLALLLTMNASAILIRNRYSRQAGGNPR